MIPFLDTNILIYAVGTDSRRNRALDLIGAGGLVSAQVLSEFVNVARRKLRWDWPQVDVGLEGLQPLFVDVLPLTLEVHRLGLQTAQRYQLRIFDACIIASASLAGCKTLYSEDLTDGAVIAGVRIINPFKAAPEAADRV